MSDPVKHVLANTVDGQYVRPVTVYRILATRDDGRVMSYHTDYLSRADADRKAQEILAHPNCTAVEVVERERGKLEADAPA